MFPVMQLSRQIPDQNHPEKGLHWARRMLQVGLLFTAIFMAPALMSADLAEVKQQGVLRHLGVPYANFVNGTEGLDIELTQLFAASLKLRYEFVPTDWDRLLGDLTGHVVKPKGEKAEVLQETPIRGDLAACGITVIPWRQSVVAFSQPVFPTQVWLIAKATSPIKPIKPSGNLTRDIASVKKLLNGQSLYCKENTCLAPGLYNMDQTGAKCLLFAGSLNDLAPAVIKGEASFSLLDVPDTLVALQKWPGQIKVIGPISPAQEMATAFRKDAPNLLAAYNLFLQDKMRDGTYRRLVDKHYPFVNTYFPAFFNQKARETTAGK
jgi:ABC-type amino acid transport substrate-binding protein